MSLGYSVYIVTMIKKWCNKKPCSEFMARCVLWVTGVSRTNSQSIWLRAPLSTSQLGRSIFAFGPWFPQLRMDRFLARHPPWLQLSLSCWKHGRSGGCRWSGSRRAWCRARGGDVSIIHYGDNQRSSVRAEILRGRGTLAVRKATFGHNCSPANPSAGTCPICLPPQASCCRPGGPALKAQGSSLPSASLCPLL